MAERTHPDLASLVDPLYATHKEGELQYLSSSPMRDSHPAKPLGVLPNRSCILSGK
ncbi:MAG: hypothetical protein ABI113_07045 [Mucilaginibacter sp.]